MSSDSDDSEYVPDENEKIYDEDSGSGGESEEDCDSEEDGGEDEKPKRRKPAAGGNRKGRKRRKKVAEPEESEDEKEEEDESKVEDEKERADALWQSFLSDPGSASKSKTDERTTAAAGTSEAKSTASATPKTTTDSSDKTTTTDKEVTEPEKVERKAEDGSKPVAEEPKKFAPRRIGGGLSSVLSSLNKKNKLTVLEKSKLDWSQFKDEHNLKEELQTFNRGKHGYLDKQDFLQRTDSRQFEIEKSLRAKK